MTSREAETQVTLTHYVYTPAAIEQTIREFHELCGVEADVEGESTQTPFPPEGRLSEHGVRRFSKLRSGAISPRATQPQRINAAVARNFYTIETYGGKPESYSLLPFRFLALSDSREVLVNDVGDYLIAERGTARALARRTLDIGSDLYQTLKAKQFLYDADSAPLLDVLATKYRTKKSFLTGFTKLHIFVVTLRCDHSCHYCQVSRQSTDRSKYDMALSTATRSLELMMQSPSKAVTLEFQGGEPLLAFDRIKEIVPRAKELAAAAGKDLDIVVVTSLVNATDDMLRYFRDERVKISTSLDGPAFIHNANRPRPGNNSYELTVQNIQRARDIVGVDQVAALMTTTRLSLDYPVEIIDEYVRLNFRSIFLASRLARMVLQ